MTAVQDLSSVPRHRITVVPPLPPPPVCAATTARQISPTSVPHEAVFCTEFSVLLHSLGRGFGALSRLQAGAAAAHVEAAVPKSSLWCCEVGPVCPPPAPLRFVLQ